VRDETRDGHAGASRKQVRGRRYLEGVSRAGGRRTRGPLRPTPPYELRSRSLDNRSTMSGYVTESLVYDSQSRVTFEIAFAKPLLGPKIVSLNALSSSHFGFRPIGLPIAPARADELARLVENKIHRNQREPWKVIVGSVSEGSASHSGTEVHRCH